jgi:hypothetical protein
MRHARRVLSSAAAAGVALFAAACVVPPAGLAPRPDEGAQDSPEVAFYSFDSEYYNTGSGLLSYSTSRDAYSAVFQVDQRGRVRVLSPSAPGEAPLTRGGQSYVVYPLLTATDPTFLPLARDFDRIPYVFAITSDAPLDLQAFERGKAWGRSVSTGDDYRPDSVIARVADQVLPGGIDYSADYAYVGPRSGASVGTSAFLADCARPVEDVHDYRYFRELWAVFDLQDPRFGPSPVWLFSPALGWGANPFYGGLSFVQYRAQFAMTAFRGACGGLDSPAYAVRYAGLGYGGYPYGYSPYGYNPYGFAYGYPYGSNWGYPYGYGYAYAPGTRPGGWTTGTRSAPASPGLRLPRTPISFTNPVTVAGTSAQQATRLPWWMAGRRSDGGGRALGEAQGFRRPGTVFGGGEGVAYRPAPAAAGRPVWISGGARREAAGGSAGGSGAHNAAQNAPRSSAGWSAGHGATGSAAASSASSAASSMSASHAASPPSTHKAQ